MMDTAAASGTSPLPSSSSSTLPITSSWQSSEVCKYYKLGTCIYGATCRFAHTDAPSEATVPASTITSSFTIDPLKWINAPEFIPKAKLQVPEAVLADTHDEDGDDEMDECDLLPDEDLEEDQQQDEEASTSSPPQGSGGMSYAAIVTMNNNHNGLGIIEHSSAGGGVDSSLCPYYEASGVCMLEGCPYEHGDLCELCGKFCLNPADKEQQRQHNVECIKQHELDMEHSFAIQRSKDKICGICLEVILEKPGREQRFGILPNCNHIFCLECIRTWRKAKNFENKIKRGCPTCRISSDFVCPSIVWVEGPDDKDKLINDYKKACNTTHCKHFKQGQGKCPFGNKCFYKHALPSGQLVDVGGPSRQLPENRLRISHLQDFFREVLHQRGRLLDDFMSSFFSDSEESEMSELYDYYDI